MPNHRAQGFGRDPQAARGYCAPGFEAVREAFDTNLKQHGEVGGSVCVLHKGRKLVDLWGGTANPATGAMWMEDTVGVVFSCTKGATSAVVHHLAATGVLDLDAPVMQYWPAFGENGKAATTLRMVLNHTAGLPALRQRVRPDGLLDHDGMARLIAAESPFWAPGTRVGYHAITFGFILGEVVRRVTGRTLGQVFRAVFAEPLGLDFYIGTPDHVEPRIAPAIPYRPPSDQPETPFLTALKSPGSPTNLMLMNAGDWSWRGVNTRSGREAEIPAANGVTNARGLASFYAGLMDPSGPAGFGTAQLAGFARPEAETDRDETLLAPLRFGPGFMLAMDRRNSLSEGDSLLMGQAGFGHVGMGGSAGLADPASGLAFGYTMNAHGSGFLMNVRGRQLLEAVYRCIDAPA